MEELSHVMRHIGRKVTGLSTGSGQPVPAFGLFFAPAAPVVGGSAEIGVVEFGGLDDGRDRGRIFDGVSKEIAFVELLHEEPSGSTTMNPKQPPCKCRS